MATRGGVAAAVLVAFIAACRPPAVARDGDAWLLVHPPDLRMPEAPGGVWLLPEQPLERWQPTGRFATEPACDAARRKRIDETIDAARARLGSEAKYDLDVRRAVNACCIRAGSAGDPRAHCRRDGAPVTPP